MGIMDRLVRLQVNDPKVLTGPKSMFGVLSENGEHTMTCECGQEVRFTATLLNCTLLAVGCPECKDKHFKWPKEAPRPEPQIVEPKLNGDGENGDVSPPRIIPHQHKPPCPLCGGESRGRGYTHNEVDGEPCPDSTEAKLAAKVAAVERCPGCRGLKRGKGYTHNPVNGGECPVLTKLGADRKAALLAAKPPKAIVVCPSCGGPKRGKGYTHQEVNGQPCPVKAATLVPKVDRVSKPPRPLGQRGKRRPRGLDD